jgi:broad specificity phosphatase PhoE
MKLFFAPSTAVKCLLRVADLLRRVALQRRMNEKRIFLARHGQTFQNAAAGESYIDADRLSRTGWEQARRLGRLLAPRNVKTVVTSPLARALETAEAVNETLGCALEEDEQLIEIVPPAQTPDDPESEVEHWSVYMARHADDRQYAVGGAESFAAVMERVRGVVDSFQRRDRALIVSHAGFLRFVMGYLTWGEEFSPRALPRLWVFELHNAGVSELRHVASRAGYERSEGWSIVTWMQRDHLDGA